VDEGFVVLRVEVDRAAVPVGGFGGLAGSVEDQAERVGGGDRGAVGLEMLLAALAGFGERALVGETADGFQIGGGIGGGS